MLRKMIETPSYRPGPEDQPHRQIPSIHRFPASSTSARNDRATSGESQTDEGVPSEPSSRGHTLSCSSHNAASEKTIFVKDLVSKEDVTQTKVESDQQDQSVRDTSAQNEASVGKNAQDSEVPDGHHIAHGRRLSSVHEKGADSWRNGTERHKHRQSQADLRRPSEQPKDKVLKLSSAKIQELTSSPESIPTRALPSFESSGPQDIPNGFTDLPAPVVQAMSQTMASENRESGILSWGNEIVASPDPKTASFQTSPANNGVFSRGSISSPTNNRLRPSQMSRAISSPSSVRKKDEHQSLNGSKKIPPPLNIPHDRPSGKTHASELAIPSPMPSSIPLPPISLATYLQLELSSNRPSPLYIHRSKASDFPYESSKVKLERLYNFLFLGYHLEQVLWFGTLACLDSWLYCFTILPLRFAKAIWVLLQWLATNFAQEVAFVTSFIWKGTGRMWKRSRKGSTSASASSGEKAESDRQDRTSQSPPTSLSQARHNPVENPSYVAKSEALRPAKIWRRHRRTKSVPSLLLPSDKADLLKGLLIIFTSLILMRLDASRMYHWIRMQAAIKLYVIYNVLEVGDRLFSAIGQDILECLFSKEALERKADGRSKVLRPFWLFLLALAYTTLHATGLFYQVITLNVAVNSYSNALITLLMSNQFVEIKSTVFKKFEKENLFQLTCADVVERFQLWVMLTIIASRNFIETGGFNVGLSTPGPMSSNPANASDAAFSHATPPRSATSILPQSFMIIPGLFSSLTAYAPTVGQVLGPFLVVLGSEMAVDWLKHCYITKFNNTKPTMYNRFLDILAKDYYVNAFADQNLTKRLGLPVIPLSCLFIRAGVQTYQMLVAAWSPPPIPSSATSLTSVHDFYTVASSEPTTTTMALHQRVDHFLHQVQFPLASATTYSGLTTLLVFLLGYFVLLAVKLVLGMVLLSFSRSRYRSMKEREDKSTHTVEGGKRVGGWGVVEVDEEKRRVIYEDDPDGLRSLKERESRDRDRNKTGDRGLEGVQRYEMAAKRIW